MLSFSKGIAQGRLGATLMEVSVCLVILAILASILLPTLGMVRESSRNLVCKNNLQNIGAAGVSYSTNKKHFPAGRDARERRQTSWATRLLTLLEQNEIYDRYDSASAWNSTKNSQVVNTTIPIFRCPSTEQVDLGQSDYAGNYGSRLTGLKPGFRNNEAWSSGLFVAVNIPSINQLPIPPEKVRDGLSHTLMVVECSGLPLSRGGGWANGHHCVAHDSGRINEHRSLRIFSDHPGGANVVMGDGCVQFLNQEMDLKVLGALCTRSNSD